MEKRENGMYRGDSLYGYNNAAAGQIPANSSKGQPQAGGAAQRPAGAGAPLAPAPARMPKARVLELASTLKKSLAAVSLVAFAAFSGLAAYHQAQASSITGPTNNSQTLASANANTTASCSTQTNHSNGFFKHDGDGHFHDDGGDNNYRHEGDEHGGDDDQYEHQAAPTATTNQPGCTTSSTSGSTGGANTPSPSGPVSGTSVS